MERCSNCGAAARPGAKFCTTCGYRLQSDTPSESAAPASDPMAAEPAGATAVVEAEASASATETGWPPSPVSSATAPDPAATARSSDDPIPLDAGDDGISETAETGSREPATDAAPSPDDADSETAITGEPAASGEEPTEASDQAGAGADEVISSSWPPPESPSWGAGWDSTVTASDDDPTGGETGTDTANEPVSEATEASSPAWWSEASASDETATEVVIETEATGDFEAADAAATGDTATTASWSSTGTDGESATDVSEVQSGDDLTARAHTLIDELRALLPKLAVGSGRDLSIIADELEIALADDAANADGRSGLRDALETAREHPRSIDSVLALSGRVEEIIALLDRQDRLVDAVRQAVNALRAESRSPDD